MTIEEKITNLTLKQALVVAKMIDAPNRCMVFSQQEDGGVIGSLSKLGFVEPFGKVGAATVWRVSEGISASTANRNLVKEIATNTALIVNEIPTIGGEPASE